MRAEAETQHLQNGDHTCFVSAKYFFEYQSNYDGQDLHDKIASFVSGVAAWDYLSIV